MNIATQSGRASLLRPCWPALVLLSLWAAFAPPAAAQSAGNRGERSGSPAHGVAPVAPGSGMESLLGIPIYPGSELIALEGPSLELVDIRRPGWECIAAEVLVADFLVDDPLADLRTYYRHLCVRDPMLLLTRVNDGTGEIISVRFANRHPFHREKRWLRIVTYRPPPDPAAHRDGE